jgi:hypothetical protein
LFEAQGIESAVAEHGGVDEQGCDAYLDALPRQICTRTWATVTETDVAKLCGFLAQQAKRGTASRPALTTVEDEDPFCSMQAAATVTAVPQFEFKLPAS